MPAPLNRLWTGLLAAALVLALAPAAGAGSEGRPVPDDVLGWKAHLARFASGRGDADSLGLALRGAVEELAGVSAPMPGASEDEEEGWDEGWLRAVPAGDLDADGLDDALEYVFLYDIEGWDFRYEERTTAVRSTDGESLWTVSAENESVYLVPAGDLDGEGGDDLLAFTISWADVPATYFWLVGVSGIRGSDGAELWSRTYPNPFTWAGSGPTVAAADVDYAIPLQLAGDADGDGVGDLLMGRYTFAGLWDYATGIGEESGNAVFELVSGATGSSISMSPVVNAGWADGVAIPDADGDGGVDVATLEGGWDEPGGTVTARSGADGRELWTAEVDIPLDGWSFMGGAEMSGDGAGDVLVRSYTFVEDDWDFYFGPQQVEALSGVDGASLWDTQLPAFTGLFPTGDASGDGGDDLLAFPRDDRWSPPELRTAHLLPDVLMLSGSDGGKVWGRSPRGGRRPGTAGDLDGDGVVDVRFRVVRKVKTDQVLGGAHGKALWKVAASGGPPRSLWGDLDGDGRDDLVDRRGRNYRPRRGRNGTPMWRKWRATDGWLSGLSVAGSDDGGPGVLLVSSREMGKLMLTGRSAAGAVLWTRTLEF